jgi:hypothetical protein
VCDSHLRSAHWRVDVRGNRPDRVGCLEALARLGVADPLGGRSEMMVTALASEFADISRSGQAGWCRMIVFMSILQTCAEAEAVIARARSRFGDATTSPRSPPTSIPRFKRPRRHASAPSHCLAAVSMGTSRSSMAQSGP